MRRKQKRWTSAAARRICQLTETAATVEQAVEITALRLLDGIPCPPTDLDALKDRLNVTAIEPIPGLPISGELRKDGDSFVIVHSASLSPGRRRFTIAHELGHAVFESTGPNCPRYGRELERICDMLAAEFLMPRRVFSARLGPTLHPEQVFQLAREFETSIMASALRCNRLLGTSIFQVEDGRVVWGYGAIRHQRDLQVDVDAFQNAIKQAMDGTNGEIAINLRRCDRGLQWSCSPGQRRALFVVQQRRRDSSPKLEQTVGAG